MSNSNKDDKINYKISMMHSKSDEGFENEDGRGEVGDAGVNCPCHSLNVRVPANNKHVIRHPRVVPIFWGHYYATNSDVIATTVQLLVDIVSGPYMNGLAQYGVSRGIVLGSHTIDINPTEADPVNLDRNKIKNTLVNWINNGTVSPTPSVNEQNLIYVIFMPTRSTITDSGAAGYHNFAKINENSSNDDLFGL